MAWRGPSSMASAEKSANATARARRTSSGRWVWWSTWWCSGTPCTWDAVLPNLRRRGVESKPEDVARLSPLGHENINFLGRYSFALAESVARGELRPLHDPEETGSQEESRVA